MLNNKTLKMQVTINFEHPLAYLPENFKSLDYTRGVYFIFTQNRAFDYPYQKSRLLYIGMSESAAHSIGKRL